MPYKDENKRKEANRLAKQRARKGMTKQGMTGKGMTSGVIPEAAPDVHLAPDYVMTDFEREHYKPASELEPNTYNPVSKPGDEHYQQCTVTELCRYCGEPLPALQKPRRYTGACYPCSIEHKGRSGWEEEAIDCFLKQTPHHREGLPGR